MVKGDEGKHLFFLIHGLFGRKNHMKSMHDELERQLPADQCIVYSSHTNELINTFEGIRTGTRRIYMELLHLLSNGDINRISIIGYSMGGLYARYLVGMLYEIHLFDQIDPVNFITVATPHLGTMLWKPTLKTKVLNVFARILLGPSGIDLMDKSFDALLNKMCEPGSVFMEGLHQFENHMLFCNAIGDRTVKFWTSFITDKHPFGKHHDSETDLVFFTYNKDKCEPFFVDLNQSSWHEDRSSHRSRNSESSLFWKVAPLIIFTVLGSLSLYSWLKFGFDWPIVKFRANRTTRRYKEKRLGTNTTTMSNKSRRRPSRSEMMEEDMILAAEELPPSSSSSSREHSPSSSSEAKSLVTSTEPRPYNPNEPNLIDSTPHRIKFNDAIATRARNLNTIPWKKYVVYMHHFRTHALIIDRLQEGESQGTETLRFLAENVVI